MIKVSLHSLLRYIERSLHLDVELERARASMIPYFRDNDKNSRYYNKVSDAALLKYLERKYKKAVLNARADLDYLLRGKKDGQYYEDDMRFVIRDNTLITFMILK